MQFSELFKVFSKRAASLPKPEKSLTPTFRNRVLMRCRDVFQGTDFWHEIHPRLTYLHGRPCLTNSKADSPAEDTLAFLLSSAEDHFLDFIEYIFRTQA